MDVVNAVLSSTIKSQKQFENVMAVVVLCVLPEKVCGCGCLYIISMVVSSMVEPYNHQ
jgi:hypothetical protein